MGGGSDCKWRFAWWVSVGPAAVDCLMGLGGAVVGCVMGWGWWWVCGGLGWLRPWVEVGWGHGLKLAEAVGWGWLCRWVEVVGCGFVVVIGEVVVGFGCGFVVGSDRGEFDLILGLNLVLRFWFLIWLEWVLIWFTVRRRKGSRGCGCGCGCGYGWWWQWVLAVAVGSLVVKEMWMRIKNNILMKW